MVHRGHLKRVPVVKRSKDLDFRLRPLAHLNLDFPTSVGWHAHSIVNMQRLWVSGSSNPQCVLVCLLLHPRTAAGSVFLMFSQFVILRAQGAPSQVAGPRVFLIMYKRENTLRVKIPVLVSL